MMQRLPPCWTHSDSHQRLMFSHRVCRRPNTWHSWRRRRTRLASMNVAGDRRPTLGKGSMIPPQDTTIVCLLVRNYLLGPSWSHLHLLHHLATLQHCMFRRYDAIFFAPLKENMVVFLHSLVLSAGLFGGARSGNSVASSVWWLDSEQMWSTALVNDNEHGGRWMNNMNMNDAFATFWPV